MKIIKFFVGVLVLTAALVCLMDWTTRKPAPVVVNASVQQANDVAATVAAEMARALPEDSKNEANVPLRFDCNNIPAGYIDLVANALWQKRGSGLSTEGEAKNDWMEATAYVHHYCVYEGRQ